MSKDKIIVALDVDSEEKALELVRELAGEVGAFKAGLELLNVAGPQIFGKLKAAGADRIFYDAKFHDIPNTVAGAVRAAVRQGVWMVNVHASGGSAMMKAAVEAAQDEASKLGIEPPKLIAVTVLTSIDTMTLTDELRIASGLVSQVVHLAKLAKSSGMDGVVASPNEAQYIREAVGPDFLIVTPGVRPAGADIADQKRVTTPAKAIAAGANYLVIGRPITRAENPVEAARAIAAEIETKS
ncbi:MAG TPA: orotidine-5'-phosphate decarboxylase [Armatimonadota bacterium]|nr:orotidine-5'-phosphate decarboxylase [Armatimonadota bacterium]